MATKRDYYEVLGVPKSASEIEIKTAYRKLARKHHPDVDKTPGAETRFKEISEAYQVLSDTQKKSSYDQFGHSAFARDAGSGGQGWPGTGQDGGWQTYNWSSGGGSSSGGDFGGFEDPFELFEQIFGGGSPFGGSFRKRPTYQLELNFSEAIHGVTKEVEIESRNSQGRLERKRMKIKVPAGVDNGTKIRFGPSADGVDIVFHVNRNPEFIREGADIFSEITINIPQLVLGDVFEVNTVQGRVKVKVPPGTQPGSLVKLKGKGVSRLGNHGYGDHYVRVNLQVPQNPSKQERQLYEELKNLSFKKKSWF